MSTQTQRAPGWFAPAVLLLVGAGVVAAYATSVREIRRIDGLPGAIVAGSCGLAALVILSRTRRPGAWRSALWLGLGALALAAIGTAFMVLDLRDVRPARPTAYDAAVLVVGVLFVAAATFEFRTHIPREDRREILGDIALIGVSLGTLLYLYVRPEMAEPTDAVSAAVFASMAAVGFTAFGALALWLPTPIHLTLSVTIAALAAGLLRFAQSWVTGTFRFGDPWVDVPLSVSVLVIATTVWLAPRHGSDARPAQPARYGRALLTTLSVTAACATLILIARMEIDGRVGAVQGSALIGLLAVAVVLRIMANQVRGAHAQKAVHEALDQKEIALRETDKALARLRRANETLRESEERLRTVFEAAVDGIVELDHRDVIVRANGAFCRMIELPQSLVEGQPWTALSASIEADDSFSALPQTGQGTLMRDGHAVYLESRMSEIPGDQPRRLLLVRDVTAARVADQTIRSLFKFLQDRDEDRTRIMRRTNAAIEGERNRIARDLHDGPVQGVSAASLSLEAVLLMLRAGEIEEGLEVLAKVRQELSEEADNLRRLMSGLRPPLLEERGLIPALRETLDKFGGDNGVRTDFVGRSISHVPPDLETLAFRIVQEALANSAKHARARSIMVAVESLGGQLRIEVADDGVGFDSAKAREYLQMGRVGLASMRERVELANGTFMVHSTPGKGTTVLATLPLDAVPAPREFSVSEAS
ncbi:MAG TPA: ATP-binding protein [Actinomycetota bacterium]|nr:ATP-binding protein [Actinomycetota bacterium]